MTKTTQLRTLPALNEAEKDLTIKKSETEYNKRLTLSLYDGLNTLYEKLNRLNYLMEKKIIELKLYQTKGEGK